MTFGARFLSEPDLFPGRQSGEPWGDERVGLRCAGDTYVCRGLSPAQAAAVRVRFGRLCTPVDDSRGQGVEIRVFRASDRDFVHEGRDWEFDFDLDYSAAAVHFAGFRFLGRLDRGPPLSAALWTPEDERLVSHAIFENTLRVVVAYNLLRRGSVLLHSAAAASDSGAHVFFGPSGAGKSTIARILLGAGYAVLSDDMNALHVRADGVFVERLPFAGDLGQTMETDGGVHPVRSLCRLEKGGTAGLRAAGPAPAIAGLLECAPFVNRNPYGHDELVERLEALHARSPVRVLTFAVDDGFLHLLDAREAG